MNLNENEIVKKLAKNSNGFIGDDSAILPSLDNEQYVITKDLLIENIHFRTSYYSAKNLAHKALHVNLSDLAAMGATPKYILCGIAIPDNSAAYAQEFLENLLRLCIEENIILIGGDTTKSPDKISISITAIGTCNPENIKYRNSAQNDDIICVAGFLGYSRLGLFALENNLDIDTYYKNFCLEPNAKIKEGQWLSKHKSITSMMDISDGLYIDVKRLCESSDVGAIIDLDKLNLNQQFVEACKLLKFDPTQVALSGGEDYSLLFTVKGNKFKEISNSFFNTFKYELKPIGKTTSSKEVIFNKQNKPIDLKLTPFTHFGEKL